MYMYIYIYIQIDKHLDEVVLGRVTVGKDGVGHGQEKSLV